jgi:hypothetical protein
MDPRLASSLARLEELPEVESEGAQMLLRTLASLLEAHRSDGAVLAMLREQLGPCVEPWTFEVRISEEEEARIVGGLADLAIRVRGSASAIHAIRKASCLPMLHAIERLLRSRDDFDGLELETLIYTFSDLKVCPREAVVPLLSGEAASKVLRQAMSTATDSIKREAAGLRQWLEGTTEIA